MAVASLGRQVAVLVRRNFLIKRRNVKQVVQEAFFPVIYAVILVVIAGLIPNTAYPAVPSFPAVDPVTLWANNTRDLAYAPSTSAQVTAVMQAAVASMGLDPSQLKGFATADDLAAAYPATDLSALWAAVEFDVDASGSLGNDVSYALRLPSNQVPGSSLTPVSDALCRTPGATIGCPSASYYTSGFVMLQKAIGEAIILDTSGLVVDVQVDAQQYPKEAYVDFSATTATLAAIYLVFAFQMLVQYLIVNIVTEKELKFKQAMVMMGMRTSSFIISWFVTYAIIMLFTTIVITIIVTAGPVMPESNFFIIFIMLFLYCLSTIAIAFLISPFFNNAKIAGFVGSLVLVVLSVIYVPLNGLSTPASASVKWATSLLSPVALSLGIGEAVYLEALGPGAQFSNIGTGYSSPGYSISSSIIMLLVDIVLYIVLGWYLDCVLPSDDSVPLSPLFPFQRSYWAPKRPQRAEDQAMRTMPVSEDEEPVTVPPGARRTGVEIDGVTKVFAPSNRFHSNKPTKALNGVNLQMDKGQIFGLLGHNGAGKSTLVSILCGMATPTSGSAKIFGMDSVRDAALIRPMMGVCLQINILFEQLTVREHLEVVGGIKGVPAASLEATVNKLIVDIDLKEQAETPAGGLSGGQKRKLCVGMALIGNPQILFLDEPTSGMDPYSRRKLWDLLLREKQDRVTLLTTHFMDEADVLTDRKAILSHGHVRCCGSSLFLKSRFGLGYVLTVVTNQETDRAEATNKLKELVCGRIPEAALARDVGREVVFRLPLKSSTLFADLFDALDAAKASVGFNDYVVSMTTLEEVFVRLEHDDVALSLAAESGGDKEEDKVMTYSPFHVDMQANFSGEVNQKDQFWLLTRYRFIQSMRQPVMMIVTLFLPAIFIVIGLSLYKFIPSGAPTAETLDLTVASAFATNPAVPVYNATDLPLSAYLPTLPYDTVLSSAADFYAALPASLSAVGFNYTDINEATVHAVLFNDDRYTHAFPVYFGALLSTLASNLTSGAVTITTRSSPLLTEVVYFDAMAYVGIYLIANALAFVPGSFAVDIVRDRQNKVKHQLEVSGASRMTYWLSMFGRSFASFSLSGVLVLVLVAAFQLDSLTGLALFPLFIVIFVFIAMILLFVFLVTFLYDNAETVQQVLPPLINFVGIIPYFVVAGLDQSGLGSEARIVHYIFMVVDPPYAILGSMYFVNRIYTASVITGTGLTMADYFEPKNDVLPSILIMLGQLFVFAAMLYFKDIRQRHTTVNPNKLLSSPTDDEASLGDKDEVDPGVVAERADARSSTMFVSQHPIAVRHLVRTVMVENKDTPINVAVERGLIGSINAAIQSRFGPTRRHMKPKHIVNDVTFGVSSGECLGLLGPNGAGKTTTMSVLTGDVLPDGGVASLGGHDIVSNRAEALRRLGFCPQFDAHIKGLTPREHLTLFASLKGVSATDVAARVNAFLDGLGLTEYADRVVDNLSGGTKRKVSFAMAMIGNPSVVILDEPSTGMDPSSKRFLWDVILDHLKGRASILTTHSMDEAEALCSRIAIMVNGRLQCIGTAQSLRQHYGDGFLLELSVHPDRAADTRAAIAQMFPESSLIEGWGGHLSYKVKQAGTSLSAIFRNLEECKARLGVEEYSFSQTTLEQVFVAFAKRQDDA